MNKANTNEDAVLSLAREVGILRVRDLATRGIHPEYLRRLHKKGLLIRTARGLYMLSDAPETQAQISEHQSLLEVAKRVPNGVACLLTALRFHDLGSQNPRDVWVAVDRRAAKPRITHPPVRIVRFSGKALTEGVGRHWIAGVSVNVYNPAKTVADCFKYRNKIGLDVAQDALRDCLSQRKCTIDDLWRYAKICRVTEVIRPHLEALR